MIVFLVGLSIGLDRQAAKNSFEEESPSYEFEYISPDEHELIEQQNDDDYFIYEDHLEQDDHFTHKIAIALESLVSAFYKLIIDILYYFAKLFL